MKLRMQAIFVISFIALSFALLSGCALESSETAFEVELGDVTAECLVDSAGVVTFCGADSTVLQKQEDKDCSDDINGDGTPDICLCGSGGDCVEVGEQNWECGC